MLFSRRSFLAASASTALLTSPAIGQTGAPPRVPARPAPPSRLHLAGAYAMTMTPAGDVPQADILIEDGRILDVGRDLSIGPFAERVDMTGQILLPGFIDTHSHLWLTQLRGRFRNTPESAYFPLVARLSRAYRAHDVAAAVRLSALESLAAGITFTTAFFDNAREPDLAVAAVDALEASGIKARFLYAGHDDLEPRQPMLLDAFLSLAEQTGRSGGRVQVGLGWRGLTTEDEDANAVLMRELDVARERGLPISTHARTTTTGPGSIAALLARGALGEDMLLVHATGITADQIGMVNAAGAAIALTPVTEQRVGFGLTRLADFSEVERLSLGIDGNALAGSADMFEQMRLLALTSSGAAKDEFAIDPRRLLALATIDGARALGIAERTGSIERGKAADIVALDPLALNLAPAGPNDDPAALIVYSAKPENVRSVLVDGAFVKRDFKPVNGGLDEAVADARRSAAAIMERAKSLPNEPEGPSAP